MSKNILIVESDTALSATLRQALEARGFAVQETTDGKGSVEQIRRDRPELVVLAVDLSAGQNGYLICGKLKKDDELKPIPIIIIGNPDGFAQHRKLKAHADDYVAKPVLADELVERVGGLIGFPELPAGEVVDDGFSLGGLDGVGDEPVHGEELAIEGEPLESHGGDELSMLDSTFGDAEPALGSFDEPTEPPARASALDDDFSLDSLGGGGDDSLDSLGMDDEKTMVGFMPTPPPPAPVAPPAPVPAPVAPPVPRPSMTLPVAKPAPAPAPAPAPVAAPVAVAKPAPAPVAARVAPAAPTTSAADMAELRNLRARVAELEGSLDDARGQASSAESRAQELQAELDVKSTELETVKSSVGKNDQATLQLREASNRKDREILRLKTELNQKEQEIVEQQDRQLALEQQAGSATEELTRKDSQLKLLQTKADQLTAERRRIEQQFAAAREEARGATARAATLQSEVDQYQAQLGDAEEVRARAEQLDAELAAARGDADAVRAELDATRGELDATRAQAAQDGDELRRRIAELEESVSRNEDRVARLYTRIKSDEKLREKTKKAIAIATQLLEEQPVALPADEEAVA
jgi:CheY-like chemotaxis protein